MLRVLTFLARTMLAMLASVAAGCSGAQYVLVNAPTVFGSYQRHADLSYGTDPRQKLDVYAPHGAHARPVVIFWYGGSWQKGGKSFYRFVGAALAERGIVAVLPDYRLYPQVRFPTFLHDAAQSVAWVQQHAAEFGGDPQRIVLMGHSAGAHIAAYLAFNHRFLAADGARPEWIRGLIGLSGPYALHPNSDVLKQIFASPYTQEDWQPVHFVDASAPPVLLFHGTDDKVVEVAHAYRLRDALQAQKIPVDAQFLPGRGHADTVAAFSVIARRRAPVLERSVSFIERVCDSSGAARGSSSPPPASSSAATPSPSS